jgi:hypothetical protein
MDDTRDNVSADHVKLQTRNFLHWNLKDFDKHVLLQKNLYCLNTDLTKM